MLHWLTWFLQSERKIREIKPLPDDLIVEILSRLSTNEVLKCRKVCRTWRSLTLTLEFVELHLQRAVPNPIVFIHHHILPVKEPVFFILDETTKMKRICGRSSVQKIAAIYGSKLGGSCNGLLLFKPLEMDYEFNNHPLTSLFFLCNPITDEVIMLENPFMEGYVCGLFFHSLTKEYRILYVIRNKYFILTIGRATPWRSLGSFAYVPHSSCVPVRINQTLHWMVEYYYYENEIDISPCENSILLFNVETEAFRALPRPGNQCVSRLWRNRMHLFDMDGRLSFWCVFSEFIHGWVLNDCDTWDWAKTFEINLDTIAKRYPSYNENGFGLYGVDLINIQNKELLVWPRFGGVLRYNLETNLITGIKWARIYKKFNRINYMTVSLTSYTPSLVSLRYMYEGHGLKINETNGFWELV